jgi:Zn-dependent protease with chaperone function
MSNSPFKAFVFGPNLPVNGLLVSAYFKDEQLHIVAPNTENLIVDISALHVTAGGFDHTECFMNWQGQNASHWILKPFSKDDMAVVLETIPATLKPQFKHWHRKRHRINFVWGSLASVVAVVVIAFGLVWWQYDRVVTWATDHVTISKEQELGSTLLEQIKSDGDIVEHGAAVQAVSKIGTQLTQGSRYQYKWLVKKDKSINAFALPGGIVIVHSALIKKADNADELAAVLAHEIQHVEQRHALKNMVHNLGWAAALMVVLGDVNIATAVVVHQIGSMYFSRDVEDEADRLAFKALVKAQIVPDGLVSFFTKLQKEEGSAAEVPEWISSHPATAERIKTMQKLIQEQPCPSCKPLTLDWKRVKADKVLVLKE